MSGCCHSSVKTTASFLPETEKQTPMILQTTVCHFQEILCGHSFHSPSLVTRPSHFLFLANFVLLTHQKNGLESGLVSESYFTFDELVGGNGVSLQHLGHLTGSNKNGIATNSESGREQAHTLKQDHNGGQFHLGVHQCTICTCM